MSTQIDMCIFVGIMAMFFTLRTDSPGWFFFYAVATAFSFTMAVHLLLRY